MRAEASPIDFYLRSGDEFTLLHYRSRVEGWGLRVGGWGWESVFQTPNPNPVIPKL